VYTWELEDYPGNPVDLQARALSTPSDIVGNTITATYGTPLTAPKPAPTETTDIQSASAIVFAVGGPVAFLIAACIIGGIWYFKKQSHASASTIFLQKKSTVENIALVDGERRHKSKDEVAKSRSVSKAKRADRAKRMLEKQAALLETKRRVSVGAIYIPAERNVYQ